MVARVWSEGQSYKICGGPLNFRAPTLLLYMLSRQEGVSHLVQECSKGVTENSGGHVCGVAVAVWRVIIGSDLRDWYTQSFKILNMH
jgi:hypothetical protein